MNDTPSPPAPAPTVTIPLALYQLLLNVAGDTRGLSECNCSSTIEEQETRGRCDGSCTYSMAVRALDEATALANQTDYAVNFPADRWAAQSPAFRMERPWCGWTLAFSADSDWDTTEWGLKALIGITLLLTTADGHARPVRMTEWQRLITEDSAGIVVRELETTNYEPIPDGVEEVIRYEDIREIVVF